MNIHLNDDIFNIVLNGTKTVECRLNDEKRRNLHVGDKLIFLKKSNEDEKIESIVTELKYYKDFQELIENYSIEEVYLKECSKEDFINLINKFYTKEEQEQYGVVAIRFKKI